MPDIDTVSVTVPSEPGFLHILRQLTAGVAAKHRLTIDDIDDLKLAVDEAASSILTHLPSASAITLTLGADGSTVRAIVSSDAIADDWPVPGFLESWSWRVIGGLVGDAMAERDANGQPAIVLRKHTLAATGR